LLKKQEVVELLHRETSGHYRISIRRDGKLKAKDRLIVALDVETATEADTLIELLADKVGMFKVGSQLFTTHGPQIVKKIIQRGSKVFLDLKFHDIPHQVAGSARAAAQLGVSMFTLHASGGSEMMQRAVEGVADVAAKEGIERAAVLAVSVLTSMDANSLAEIGMSADPKQTVLRLVKLAEAAGVDGVVSSPQEVEAIRSLVTKPEFLLVTPGIRPTNANSGDQKRVATPQFALAAGSSYLVVGRPITEASDPKAAAHVIVQEMELVN
jgi:orotidine-5'-phosphate decarboxylase